MLSLCLLVPSAARADMFGADVAVLVDILQNDIQSLYQLMMVVQTAQDNLQLMRDINQGLNDSLSLAQTMRDGVSAGVYADWHDPAQAMQQLAQIYSLDASVVWLLLYSLCPGAVSRDPSCQTCRK